MMTPTTRSTDFLAILLTSIFVLLHGTKCFVLPLVWLLFKKVSDNFVYLHWTNVNLRNFAKDLGDFQGHSAFFPIFFAKFVGKNLKIFKSDLGCFGRILELLWSR